jgi:DNA-binding transcriptional MerR regulator
MRIGELAEAVGISTQTIRFYEREGLLSKPPRTSSGYREYGTHALETLGFILEAKVVGFTLNETKQLAGIDPESSQSCSFMRKLARKKLGDLDEKLGAMKRMRKRLAVLLAQCEQQEENAACPVLREFCEH